MKPLHAAVPSLTPGATGEGTLALHLRREIAHAIRAHAEEIVAAVRLPWFLAPVAGPVRDAMRAALLAAADWIDPDRPDPEPA